MADELCDNGPIFEVADYEFFYQFTMERLGCIDKK